MKIISTLNNNPTHSSETKLSLEILDNLYEACETGNVKIVQEILKSNNIDINIKLRKRHMPFPTPYAQPTWTPLMIATRYKHIALVSFLIKHPNIDFSIIEEGGWTALYLAVNLNDNFINANFALANTLIKAGANIDQIINNASLLLWAWHHEKQDIAEKLVLILGANLALNEMIYKHHLKDLSSWNQNIPNQIEQTKTRISEILNAKQLGIDLGSLFFALPQGLDQKISSFLFQPQSLNLRAFEAGRALIREQLTPPTPVSGSLTWMHDFVNEANWREWEHEYNSNSSNKQKTDRGYGPGVMIRYEH